MATITFRVDEDTKKKFAVRLNKGMSLHLRRYIEFLIALSPKDCRHVVEFIEGHREKLSMKVMDRASDLEEEPKGRITRTSL